MRRTRTRRALAPSADHLEPRQMPALAWPAAPPTIPLPPVAALRAASKPPAPSLLADAPAIRAAALQSLGDLGDAFAFTVSGSDAQGDSVTVAVSFTPGGNGDFTYDETINYSWDNATSGGADMLHVNVSLSGDTATFTTDATASDHYTINDTLSGSITGTWTDSGSDSSDYHDTFTVTPSGTTDAFSSGAGGSENYDLNASGSYGGSGFTVTDSGDDSLDYHDTGSIDRNGVMSDAPTQDGTAHETTDLNLSGGPLLYTVHSHETLHDHIDASGKAVTDSGDDSGEYRNAGPLNIGTGSFSFDWIRSDTYSNADTVDASGETTEFSGANTANDTTTVSGVDDGSGPNDDETITAVNHDYYDNRTFPAGYDYRSWGDFTDSDTGDDPGPFSSTGDGNYTVDVTPTGTAETHSPPDTVTTGTLPAGIPLSGDESYTEENASAPPFPDIAGFLQGSQAMPAAAAQPMQASTAPPEGLPSWLYRNYYEGTMFQRYLVYANPFSSVESSGTHPNDVNLHYGTQYAWGVAAGALSGAGGAYAAGALWGAGSTGGSAGSAGVLTGIAAQQYGQLYQRVVAAGAQLQQYQGRLDQLSPSELERYQALYFNYLLLWNQLYGRN